MHVIVGADIGGTSTRVMIVDRDGTVRGAGRAGGGNLRSSDRADVTAHLTRALRSALHAAGTSDGTARLTVDAAHLGIAGAGAAGRAAARATALRAWAEAGAPVPTTPVTVADDLEIAFASAAVGADGLLVLAGTGAVACRIAEGRVVDRRDGLGWLLGDEGSAVWLGLAALRAVAADLDHRGPATSLTSAVGNALGLVDASPDGQAVPDLRQQLVTAAHAVAPATHGRLAPLVSSAAAAGDEVATRIVGAAVEALIRSAGAALGDAPVPEVVVAGALLTTPGPVRDGVLRSLAGHPGAPVRPARAPVVGALLRAASHAGWPVPDRELLRAQVATSA
ncbi:N-acetylglucosamine kinase [Cellulomonas hominis]